MKEASVKGQADDDDDDVDVDVDVELLEIYDPIHSRNIWHEKRTITSRLASMPRRVWFDWESTHDVVDGRVHVKRGARPKRDHLANIQAKRRLLDVEDNDGDGADRSTTFINHH